MMATRLAAAPPKKSSGSFARLSSPPWCRLVWAAPAGEAIHGEVCYPLLCGSQSFFGRDPEAVVPQQVPAGDSAPHRRRHCYLNRNPLTLTPESRTDCVAESPLAQPAAPFAGLRFFLRRAGVRKHPGDAKPGCLRTPARQTDHGSVLGAAKNLRLCRFGAFENPQCTWVPHPRVMTPTAHPEGRMGLQAPGRVLAPAGTRIGSSKVSPGHEHRRGFVPSQGGGTV